MPNALQGLLAPVEMRETPRKNKLMGLLADALTQANQFATQMDPRYENKRQNQTLGLLADAVSLGSLAKTAERISYGEPLTNGLRGSKPLLKPETADALMMAPLSPRNALAMMGAGMADNGMMKAATVWHGSPHKFDKFKASKIGTGEGVQAYGHGLYFAENPEVAGSYIQAGRNIGFENWDDPIRLANKAFGNANGDAQKAIALLDDAIKAAKPGSRQNNLIFAKQALQRGDQTAGLYKVDLPDEQIAQMLDWDKPLHRQPKQVRRAVSGLVDDSTAPGTYAQWLRGSRPDMRDLQNGMLDGIDNAQIAEALRQRGVQGIKYLDGGSRAAGAGTSNYVVFPGNEGLLNILERNGRPVR